MVDLRSDSTVSSSGIADLLAPTLGKEKSSEVVVAVVTRLGLSAADLSPDEVDTVLEELARTPGMVGIAARFARTRLDAARSSAWSGAAALAAGSAMTQKLSGPHPPATITAVEVAALLASTMGTEKAHEIVLDAARRLDLTPDRLDKAQAMALLDTLALEPGVVGLCARFGKARLILRFAA